MLVSGIAPLVLQLILATMVFDGEATVPSKTDHKLANFSLNQS